VICSVLAQSCRAGNAPRGSADVEDIIWPPVRGVSAEERAEPSRPGSLNESQLDHDAVIQERTLVRESLSWDFADFATLGHELIRQMEVGSRIEQIKIAMRTRRRKPEQLLSQAAKDPRLDSDGQEAGIYVIHEGQVVTPGRGQELYLPGSNQQRPGTRSSAFPLPD
jgi:hypothetical protein